MFSEFVTLMSGYGWQGAALALVVLVLVYVARVNGLVVDGSMARVANVVLSSILAGLNPLDPTAESALMAVIASLGSALLYEFIQFATEKLRK